MRGLVLAGVTALAGCDVEALADRATGNVHTQEATDLKVITDKVRANETISVPDCEGLKTQIETTDAKAKENPKDDELFYALMSARRTESIFCDYNSPVKEGCADLADQTLKTAQGVQLEPTTCNAAKDLYLNAPEKTFQDATGVDKKCENSGFVTNWVILGNTVESFCDQEK